MCTRDDELTKVFARQMFMLRKKLGLSQEDMADLCGICQVQVCGYETQKSLPSLSSAVRICKATGASLDLLCGLPDDGSKSEEKEEWKK